MPSFCFPVARQCLSCLWGFAGLAWLSLLMGLQPYLHCLQGGWHLCVNRPMGVRPMPQHGAHPPLPLQDETGGLEKGCMAFRCKVKRFMCQCRAQGGERLASASAEQRPLWLSFKGAALEREFTWWHTTQMQKVLLDTPQHPGSFLALHLTQAEHSFTSLVSLSIDSGQPQVQAVNALTVSPQGCLLQLAVLYVSCTHS